MVALPPGADVSDMHSAMPRDAGLQGLALADIKEI